jgi:hypothetical protein
MERKGAKSANKALSAAKKLHGRLATDGGLAATGVGGNPTNLMSNNYFQNFDIMQQIVNNNNSNNISSNSNITTKFGTRLSINELHPDRTTGSFLNSTLLQLPVGLNVASIGGTMPMPHFQGGLGGNVATTNAFDVGTLYGNTTPVTMSSSSGQTQYNINDPNAILQSLQRQQFLLEHQQQPQQNQQMVFLSQPFIPSQTSPQYLLSALNHTYDYVTNPTGMSVPSIPSSTTVGMGTMTQHHSNTGGADGTLSSIGSTIEPTFPISLHGQMNTFSFQQPNNNNNNNTTLGSLGPTYTTDTEGSPGVK